MVQIGIGIIVGLLISGSHKSWKGWSVRKELLRLVEIPSIAGLNR
jgi:hypothetical protein